MGSYDDAIIAEEQRRGDVPDDGMKWSDDPGPSGERVAVPSPDLHPSVIPGGALSPEAITERLAAGWRVELIPPAPRCTCDLPGPRHEADPYPNPCPVHTKARLA